MTKKDDFHKPQSVKQGQAEEREIVEPLKPQLGMIPPHALKELQRLALLTGHNVDAVIAGYWYRFGEVQTLQIELEHRNKIIESLEASSSPQTSGAVCPICSNEMKPQMRCDNCRHTFDVSDLENKSCDKSCGPGDYRKGGKCDENGCYESSGDKDSEREKLLAFQRLQAKNNNQMVDELCEKDKEIERLKGLIETLHTDVYGISPQKWISYKEFYNL